MEKTRKARSKQNRTRKGQRGGGVESCRIVRRYTNSKNPLWYKKTRVTVTEDQLKMAGPTQQICLGDEFTSCMAIIVVMENNYKIAAHIQPLSYLFSTNDKRKNEATKPQKVNPVTVLPFMRDILGTVPQFQSSQIKYIYVITALFGIYVVKNSSGYLTNINNNQTGMYRKKTGRSVALNERNSREFFENVFPGKLTTNTQIILQVEKVVQHETTEGRAHFFIKEDGSLDLVT